MVESEEFTREVEVFKYRETKEPVITPKTTWEPIPLHELKKGDIFRVFDVRADGKKRPDRVLNGQPAVYVAAVDGKLVPRPTLAEVRADPVNGFFFDEVKVRC